VGYRIAGDNARTDDAGDDGIGRFGDAETPRTPEVVAN